MAVTFAKKAVVPLPSLRLILHKQLMEERPGRSLNTLHASELTKQDEEFCGRKRALMITDKDLAKPEKLSASLVATFAIGRFVEDLVLEQFATAGMLVGDWKCRVCGTMHGFQKKPLKCSHAMCGRNLFQYVEKRAMSAISGASCGIDALLDFGRGRHTVLEVKSMDKDQYKALAAPLVEHKIRTNLYMRCVEESGEPWANLVDTQQAKIIYISKGGYGTAAPDLVQQGLYGEKFSPIKEFTVQRDDAIAQPYWDKAKAVTDWLKGGPMPPRICAGPYSPTAKYCKKVLQCFAGT